MLIQISFQLNCRNLCFGNCSHTVKKRSQEIIYQKQNKFLIAIMIISAQTFVFLKRSRLGGTCEKQFLVMVVTLHYFVAQRLYTKYKLQICQRGRIF